MKSVTPIPLDSVATASAALKLIEGLVNGQRPKKKPEEPLIAGDPSNTTIESSDVASDDDYQSSFMNFEDPPPDLSNNGLLPALSSVPAQLSLDSAVIEATIEAAGTASPAISANASALPEAGGVKRLAQRLAFWNKKQISPAPVPPSSSPPSISATDLIAPLPSSPPLIVTPNPTGLIKLAPPLTPKSIPSLDSISTDQPSQSKTTTQGRVEQQSEEVKRSELEPKILREVNSLFSHGMYFAYDFGQSTRIGRCRHCHDVPLGHTLTSRHHNTDPKKGRENTRALPNR